MIYTYIQVHISTGDALRAQVSAGTDLGKMANDYMTKGALVPDELIIDIVKDRLAQPDCARKGWLLDGFPRTGVQAEAMKKAGITADHFILLNVPDQVLTERCDLVWAHWDLFGYVDMGAFFAYVKIFCRCKGLFCGCMGALLRSLPDASSCKRFHPR